ncbi:helix-turn-helix domain-containing protein [Mesorhizobium sp. SP-1A]|uniref:helix-turn-helix domain-containing protein n=1 Tax=Mesorhizobium sp. SP-1A TaxID=3077840 RepID=UPI0028F743DF|nr:helix-turn-helix domain-containing protein [Mesorhizobium sp. SP-1A]
MIYGYLRRSLIDTDEQFKEQGVIVRNLMKERDSKISAVNFVIEQIAISAQSYPELELLLDKLENGDELIVAAPDRVAGSARKFYDCCSKAIQKGAFITVVRPPVFVSNYEQPLVRPTSFKANSNEMFVLEMISSIETQVQNERTNTILKNSGRKGGRPPALSEEQIVRMKQRFNEGATQQEVSNEFEISQATVSRYYNEIILGKGRVPSSPYKKDPVVVREKRKIYERNRRQRIKEQAKQQALASIEMPTFEQRFSTIRADLKGIIESLAEKVGTDIEIRDYEGDLNEVGFMFEIEGEDDQIFHAFLTMVGPAVDEDQKDAGYICLRVGTDDDIDFLEAIDVHEDKEWASFDDDGAWSEQLEFVAGHIETTAQLLRNQLPDKSPSLG